MKTGLDEAQGNRFRLHRMACGCECEWALVENWLAAQRCSFSRQGRVKVANFNAVKVSEDLSEERNPLRGRSGKLFRNVVNVVSVSPLPVV
jgi:hypothetical protein